MPTAERGDSAGLSQGTRGWLNAAAAPGRTSLRLAAACQALETVFTVVQWAALAWVAQAVLGCRVQPIRLELGALLAGGLLAGGAAWSAARCQAAGRQRISGAIRHRLVAGPSRRAGQGSCDGS